MSVGQTEKLSSRGVRPLFHFHSQNPIIQNMLHYVVILTNLAKTYVLIYKFTSHSEQMLRKSLEVVSSICISNHDSYANIRICASDKQLVVLILQSGALSLLEKVQQDDIL